MNGIAVALEGVGALLSFLTGRPASLTDPACVAGAVASQAIVGTQDSSAPAPALASGSAYARRYKDFIARVSEGTTSPDVRIGAENEAHP